MRLNLVESKTAVFFIGSSPSGRQHGSCGCPAKVVIHSEGEQLRGWGNFSMEPSGAVCPSSTACAGGLTASGSRFGARKLDSKWEVSSVEAYCVGVDGVVDICDLCGAGCASHRLAANRNR